VSTTQRSRTPDLARLVARDFGKRLKALRREKRISQDAFAAALGVSRTTASNIERGHQRLFLDQVYRTAGILGVSPDSLLPDYQALGKDVVVHVAADDPMTAGAANQVARFARELESSKTGRSRRRWKAKSA
jgi:transcriptional regulator with XRE-family HTH domain